MRSRLNSDGGDFSPGVNNDPHFAELVLGNGAGTGYATGSNPTAQVIASSVSANLLLGQSFGCAFVLTTGLATVVRKGLYRIYANCSDISSASASGVITLEFQVNGAVIPTQRVRAKSLQAAVVNDSQTMQLERVVLLNKGDTLGLAVTGTVGGVITIVDGVIGLMQVTDVPLTVTV